MDIGDLQNYPILSIVFLSFTIILVLQDLRFFTALCLHLCICSAHVRPNEDIMLSGSGKSFANLL